MNTTEVAIKGLIEHWIAIGVLAFLAMLFKDVVAEEISSFFSKGRRRWNGEEHRTATDMSGTLTLGQEDISRIIKAFEEHTVAIRKMGELHQQHFDIAVKNGRILESQSEQLNEIRKLIKES